MYTNWSWIEMCGPGGLTVWYPTKHDIGTCFEQIFLLIPVLSLFAIFSAYYFGSHTDRTNCCRQKFVINFRFTLTLLIAFVPVLRLILGIQYPVEMFRPVDYLTAGVEIIAWFVHAGYVLSLRHSIKIHGPVTVRVLWTLVVTLAIISLRTQFLETHDSKDGIEYRLKLGLCLTIVILQIFYGLTFFLYKKERNNSNSTLLRNHTQFTEQSHLLGHHVYHGFMEDLDPEYLGVAMEDESVTSKLIFHWVNPLIKKGCDKKLETCDDLYDLPHQLSSSYLCSKLHSALDSVKKNETYTTYGSTDVAVLPEPKKVTLLKALHKCFGVEFYVIGILKLFSDLLGFGGPLLLNKLVTFIESKDAKPEIGYICAFGLFITTFLNALANVHFNFCMAKVGLKLRGSLIATIYRKTLNLDYVDINKFSIGEIVNFMSTDTDRVVNSCASFHSFWSIPLQIIVTFYLLYMQVGLAFLAGVFFTIILIPINKVIASKIGVISGNLMEQKDQRVASMAELLRGIRIIKIHVWEQHFLEKVLRIRASELKHLKARKYLDAVCVYFWATTPILISILTFTTYSLMGNQLNAAKVFTTLALLNMLIAPLNAFPWILNGLTEAWVSVLRIQKLLDCKDVNLRDYYDTKTVMNKKAVFAINNGSFQWDESETPTKNNFNEDSNLPSTEEIKPLHVIEERAHSTREIDGQVQEKKHFVLQNITTSINEGDLVGVIGPVGSGKSTFLAALIGELKKTKGSVALRNIEGGCALVTQTPWIQRGTFRENVLFGKSFDSNWYKKVLEDCCLTQDLESFFSGDLVKIGEGGMTLSGGQRSRLALARAVYQNKDIYLLDDIFASVDVHVARHIYNKVICGLLKNKTRILCSNHIQFLTNSDLIIRVNNGRIVAKGKPSEILDEFEEFNNFDIDTTESPKKEPKIKLENPEYVEETDEEISGFGSINFKVYKKYWTSIGHGLALLVLSSVVLMQATRNLTDFWLSFWVSQEAKSNSTHYALHSWIHDTKDYLKIYAALAVMNTFVTLMRSFLFAYSGIQAAIIIHKKLLKKVAFSKITFFDITPIGRILNRFSSDTYTIDDSLPFILNILLAQFFGLLGSLVVTTYGLPWLCLLLAPLVPVYHYLQYKYRNASRELKRLSSTSLSPIYSHFNDTLQGLTTIRAFRSLSQFRRINEELLECNQKANFASQAANQWLNFRLQMMGVFLVSGVGVIAVLQHEFDVVNSAIVGLTVSYALSITSLLSGVISSFTETEKEMIAMERVTQYIEEIESEPQGSNYPPYGWPGQGVIVFQGVYLKYREHIPPSLNGVSFETRPAEKIGVVGRTGAGKSSLITALIRLVNLSSGKILIDTVNINEISLQDLRSRISVIPQDPFLFDATIRTNIDPLGEYSDEEIWSALHKCHMKDVVRSLGGLETKVLAGGRNFSLGQRQLLCLVRAVLRNAKIVCVDEATAYVDTESDKKIQRTIRSSFRQSTVLTIAHRVSTVMDCDRILVLNDGEVVEFDSPKTLALDQTSYFYNLCQQEPQYDI